MTDRDEKKSVKSAPQKKSGKSEHLSREDQDAAGRVADIVLDAPVWMPEQHPPDEINVDNVHVDLPKRRRSSDKEDIRIRATPFVWRDPATLPRREWLYGRHLIRKFLSATAAPGATGKSCLEMVDVVAMVTGRNLIGAAPAAQIRAWYINLEDPAEETERRFHAIFKHYRIKADDIGDRLYTDSGRDQKVVIATMEPKVGAVIAQPVVDQLIAQIKERQIDVVVVDPFVSSHRVSENDNTAMDLVAKTWAMIADVTGCAIELVHHVRKTGGNAVTAEDARGASAITSAARAVRVLNVMSTEEANDSGVKPDDRRRYFRVGNDKPNLAPPDKSTWFHLQSVDLPNGDNVGVVVKWEWPNAFDGVEVKDLRAAQNEVSKGRWRENSQASDWVGKPIAKALGLNLSEQHNKRKVSGLLKTWIANGMFVIVTGLDEKRRTRSFVEVGTPADD